MKTQRNLLSLGNAKLGEGIYTFSIPAVTTCPGSSPACRQECYALRGNFRHAQPHYNRALAATREEGFAGRMTSEVKRRWAGCVRIHVSGDFYSAEYVRAWVAIATACPQTRFYAYTRSWRVPEMAGALADLVKCRNVRLWYSCDKDTGIPAKVARRVKLAWMQTAEDDLPRRADLVFRVHRLRKTVAKRVALALVCPVKNGATGHRTDCGRCRVCIDRPTA
jgi:hypothetical protein